MGLMEGVLLTHPFLVAWSMHQTYLHGGARCTGWPRRQRIVADTLAANVAPIHWVGGGIITWLCPTDIKYEWNNQTLRWCGWVRGTGTPSLCVLYHGSDGVKRRDHHCLSHPEILHIHLSNFHSLQDEKEKAKLRFPTTPQT